jgi:3-dehydroquinate synthase
VIRVPVRLGDRTYDVLVGRDILRTANEVLPALPSAEKAFVVSDHMVSPLYLDDVQTALAGAGLATVHLPVPQGEEAKTLKVAEALYRQLALQEAHRDDVLVGLGGGVVTDLTGFVAATYMRGLSVVHAPTTLTGQVDAAIGGKTGVNLPEGKNLVGSFHQPIAVVADVTTLRSLPDEEFRSGLAEVAKYGLSMDPPLLEVLERQLGEIVARDPEVMEELVARCVRAKAATVSRDERDAGARLVLNYGHTLGHALERLEAFTGHSHGEAVAVGMVFAARLSEALGVAAPGLAARHTRLLTSLGLEGTARLPPTERVLEAFRLDKKYRGGVRFVLLEEVGVPRIVDDVPEDEIRRTLEEMGAAP